MPRPRGVKNGEGKKKILTAPEKRAKNTPITKLLDQVHRCPGITTKHAETASQGQETGTDTVRFYGKTQMAADLVVCHGVDPKQALMLATGKTPDSGNLSRFKKKVNKYSLSRPSMVKKAFTAISDTLDMRPVVTSDGKEIFPSHTNRLAAAAMVADRVEPVVRQSLNLNLNADIAPVDLDRYR